MGIKKRSKVNAVFNMSSLTDIIFLLLIFFMLTSSLVTPNALNLQLPGKSTPAPTSKKKPNIVKIETNGTYYYNSNRMSVSGIKKQLTTLKKKNSKASVVIQTSSRTSLDYVVSILDIAQQLQLAAVVDETD